MKVFSTRAAAKKLGIPPPTLATYIRVGKIPKPQSFTSGDTAVHVWSEEDIERVRKLLPKIANGRKTRYKKKESAVSNQQSVKTKKKTQARAPAFHKQNRNKGKK
jgi:DNA-binding transcriptional MerR regulator